MAENPMKLCFQCEQNPRAQDDFVCKSCREEHKFCYECGQRERNYPFYLCLPCYEASRRRPVMPTVRTSSPSLATATPKKSIIPVVSTGIELDDDDAESDGSSNTCLLPGCERPRYREKSGYIHDFCGKSHAAEYKKEYGEFPGRKILLRLEKDQNTYQQIAQHFKKEWVKTTPAYPKPPDLIAIYAIQNPILAEKFHCYGDQIRLVGLASNSDRFFHGTKIRCDLLTTDECCSDPDCGICGISKIGFDPTLIGSNIPRFKRFGRGIYLAPNSSKCHDYTQGMPEYGVRAQLLCLVACGAKYELKQNNTKLDQPPPSFHSVYGKSGGTLNYDEIVVYDAAAVLPQFILVYEHDGVDKIAN